REISFARQFFRMNLFIIAVQENLGDPLTKCLRRKIPLNPPPMANGNAAGFLAHHDRYRIRLFRNAEPGSMSQSKRTVKRFTLTHRKNTGGGCDPSIADDYAAVVQRRFR